MALTTRCLILTVLTLLFLLSVLRCGKIKMVEEPFAFGGAQSGGGRGIGTDTQEVNLSLRYHPEECSGPPYLVENLKGKCFELISNNYKYEMCLYHNITQREQAYRWNAFNGILGVWKHWHIEGDNFTTMNYVHGDPCAGNLERETNVKLVCGSTNVLESVTEPSMCRYEMVFRTPYVCPVDVFFVYPMLSEAGKKRWMQIERDHADGVTTKKGYESRRGKLFVDEGLRIDRDLRIKTGSSVDVGLNVDHSPQRPVVKPAENSYGSLNSRGSTSFLSLQHCDSEYARLRMEVESLREQLRSLVLKSIQSSSGGEVASAKSNASEAKSSESNTVQLKHSQPMDSIAAQNSNDASKKGGSEGSQTFIKEKIRGDPGLLESASQNLSKPVLRKLPEREDQETRGGRRKGQGSRGPRGDNGVLSEENFPSRNLMGRMQYQAHMISRLKVHSRLREGRGKLVR